MQEWNVINQGENRTARFVWDGFIDLTEDDLTKSARTGKNISDIADEKQDEEDWCRIESKAVQQCLNMFRKAAINLIK